jgi:hypothetical protein
MDRASAGYARAVMVPPPSPGSTPPSVDPRLVCAECGALSDDDAHGWPGYEVGVDHDDASELVVFCEGCAELQFG